MNSALRSSFIQVACVLALAGCTPPSEEPNDPTVSLQGIVTDADGARVSGAVVTLIPL